MRVGSGALFARWLWLVYAPLAFFFILLALTFTELLPRWAIPVLLISSLWGAVSVRLIAERIRVGLAVPPPRNLVGGGTWIAGLVVTGSVLGWIGAARLSTDVGIGLALAGAFLVVFGLTAPLFKILDVALRAAGRRVARPRRTRTQPPPVPIERDFAEEIEPLRAAERF